MKQSPQNTALSIQADQTRTSWEVTQAVFPVSLQVCFNRILEKTYIISDDLVILIFFTFKSIMQFLLFVIAVVVVSASAFAPAGLRARSSMMMMAERIPIMAGNWKMNTDLEVRACFIRPRILLIYPCKYACHATGHWNSIPVRSSVFERYSVCVILITK